MKKGKKKSLVGWICPKWHLFKLIMSDRRWKEFDRIAHSDIWLSKEKPIFREGYKKVRITLEEL